LQPVKNYPNPFVEKVAFLQKPNKQAMAEIIRMPRMSDTMEEGNIVGWQKKVGDAVVPGDVLAEVETDKATMELESFYEGTLLYIGVESGAVPVNALLAIIGEKGEDFKSLLDGAENPEQQSAPIEKSASAEASQSSETSKESGATQNEQRSGDGDARLKASPLAKAIAKEAGIDLGSVTGSGGESGRIVKKDVTAFLENKPTAAPAKSVASAPAFQGTSSGYEEIPVSMMRKTIARRLGESKFSAPHFYLTYEVDMDGAIEARKRINEIAASKISFNDLVIKAVTVALRQHPAINSSWLGDKIRYNGDIHIGVAVAVDEGLLVPVLRHADQKSLSQINTEVLQFAQKAKDKKLQPEEMQGNTFTISNLGMFGIDEFTAIINPPDACILAVGGIVTKPVVINGEIKIGNRMKVTLSCDHRVVDGATGAKFLQTFAAVLSDPIRMIV
jgi:pyruvate dehydrogenase E2 component (dihydrolipoamide acetyltransferase)